MTRGPIGAPRLTIVVIVYNDAAHLPRAVASALGSTLADLEVIVVDDGSTDGTAAVADRLAAQDARARVVHLATNSGGCSRPRNVGVDAARGRYVMFLDSDDALPRAAAAALVGAAEETGADFSAGLCVRVNVDTGHAARWYAWLYTRRATYESVLDNPDLLYDTLSTNKCYQREFLQQHALRFPEGYHYEDLLFSAQAYLFARRITLIPDLVYTWHVRERADIPSITNRRFELRNFSDRIRVHRRIDELLLAHGATELKLHKDVKFLKHDLRLYLNELPLRDQDFQRAFVGLAKRYLDTLDLRAYERAGKMHAICALLLRNDDLPGVLSAVEYLQHGTLATNLVVRDGHVYWTDRHLDDPAARRILDVTDLGLAELPLAELPLFSAVTRFDVTGTLVRLGGRTTNQLGRVRADDCRVALLLRRAGSRRSRPLPMRAVRHEGGRITWETTLDLASLASRPARRWQLLVRVSSGGESTQSPLTAVHGNLEPIRVPVRRPFGRLLGDVVVSARTPDGNLELSVEPSSARVRAVQARAAAVRRWALASPAGLRARAALASTAHRLRKLSQPDEVKAQVYRRVLLRLPVRADTVLFESDGGRSASGNPRAVADALTAADPDRRLVWSGTEDTTRFPAGSRRVRRGSWRYHLALARAGTWVDDGSIPPQLPKPRGATFLQTWRGTPLERVGHERPAIVRAGGAKRLRLQEGVDRWDLLVVRGEHDVRALAGAMRFRGRLLRAGYPRNDRLFTTRPQEARAALGLEPVGRAVLYVPAAREALDGTARRFTPPLDATALAKALPGTRLLVHAPPGAAPLHGDPAAWLDVTQVRDTTTLLAAADVLVTDYSPLLFDFLLTGRPVVLFAFDLAEHERDPGLSLDLRAVAPGPLVATDAELIAALRDVPAWAPSYAESYERLRKYCCGYDDGAATGRVLRALLDARA